MGLRYSDDTWLQTSSFALLRSIINESLKGLTGSDWLLTAHLSMAFFLSSLPDSNKKTL